MSKRTIKSGSFNFSHTTSATRAKVIVLLSCEQDHALDHSWTYMHDGKGNLVLVSVAYADSTEIEHHDATLRAACRRIAVAAWARTLNDLASMG